jgi:hypothetical protein
VRFLGQSGQQRLDERPCFVQRRGRIRHRWLVDIARVPEHPGIFRELHHLINKRLQRRVQFDRLLAQPSQIVRLRERLIMSNQKTLQRFLCRLLAVEQRIFRRRRFGGRINPRAPEVLMGLFKSREGVRTAPHVRLHRAVSPLAQ